MERICYLHVGTTKTGTSTIQQSLDSNRSKLRVKGFRLLRNKTRKGNSDYTLALSQYREENSNRFTKSLKMLGISDLNKKLEFDKNTEKAYSDFINKSKSNIILTDEEFFSRSFKDQNCIPRTVEFLESHSLKCKIIVYLRNQSSWILSDYIQNIRGGGILSLEQFIKNELNENSIYDLEKFINILESSKLDLIVRPYKRDFKKHWDITKDFYKCIAIPEIINSKNFKNVKDQNIIRPSKKGIEDIIIFNENYRNKFRDKLEKLSALQRIMNNLSAKLASYSINEDPLEINKKSLSLIKSRFKLGNDNLIIKYPILKGYLN